MNLTFSSLLHPYAEDYFNEAYEDFNGKFKKVLKVGVTPQPGALVIGPHCISECV